MPMKMSTRVLSALITNIPTCVAMSFLATWLGMRNAPIPAEAFMGAYLSSVMRGILISYVVACLVGILVPLPRLGMACAGKLGLTPRDGMRFGLVMTAVINLVYVLVLNAVLTYVNVVLVNGAPLPAFVGGFFGSLVPCYVVSFVISFVWAQRAEGIARNITNDPAPRR